MPKLKINDTEIEVTAGTSVLQAAEMLGYEIPRFCYHDKLSVPANCRMCLVQVKGAPKPVASCAMAVGEGMEVYTNTEVVQKARKGVMEFLLINHPLDCPICDQGGECDLQDQAVAYGYDRSRYDESKRAVKDKELGPLVKTVMTRCIQCTRCIRFADEIAGVPDLGLLNRGEDVEISTFVDKLVGTELSGNLVDVCPVGALTNKPFAFQARAWEMRKTESIDVMDAVGSNIRIDARGGEVMRILPRLHEDVNEEWISDKARYVVDGLKKRRLDTPYIRNAAGQLKAASWDEAFAVISEKLKSASASKITALAGDLAALEEIIALKDLMNAFGSTHYDCRVDGAMIDPSSRANYLFNSGIAGIEEADAIFLIGANPRYEATMVNARIRKSWLARNKRLSISVVGTADDLTYPTINYGAGIDGLNALLQHAESFKAEKPLMIVGTSLFDRDDAQAIYALLGQIVNKFGIVRDGWNGFNMLHTAASRVGALDVGFATGTADIMNAEFVYLLGVDQPFVSSIPDHVFVVYQGSHGDAGAHRADVILPGAAYTEKNGTYVNMEGRVQIARAAVSAPGQAREDWKIIRALSDVVGKTLSYNTSAQLQKRMISEWPHLAALDVLPREMWKPIGQNGTVAPQAFVPAVQKSEYYSTNPICRASDTLKACVEAFVSPVHKMAAE